MTAINSHIRSRYGTGLLIRFLKNFFLFYQARRYIKHLFIGLNGRGHGIHSPFVFDFVKTVLNGKERSAEFGRIEALRKQLLRDNTRVPVQDLGAGSLVDNGTMRRVGSICRNTSKPPRVGRLLSRIVDRYQPKRVLELGTSLGISTAYLAAGNLEAHVTSVEGCPAIAALARQNLESIGLSNITILEGPFDEELPGLLSNGYCPDLVFIDGNHREEPTWKYFHQLASHAHPDTILIFDDIHWSPGMERAWERIKADPRVRMSIDLFFVGIVFFRDEFKVKQDFRIRW